MYNSEPRIKISDHRESSKIDIYYIYYAIDIGSQLTHRLTQIVMLNVSLEFSFF